MTQQTATTPATTSAFKNEERKVGKYIVSRVNIIGTQFWIYTCHAPNTITGTASTITTFNGQWYGQVGTDPNRALYNHLPVGPERSAAVKNAYQKRYRLAHRMIEIAFPEAKHGLKRDGEIEMYS